MKFKNYGRPIKIRKGTLTNCYWITLRTGETINLLEQVGIANGLEKVTESNQELPKVTEGQIGDKKVETKQIEDQYIADDLFFKELTKIKGIGIKTAKDILVWGTKEKLIEAIEMKGYLPFRDDIAKLLEERYGK